MYVDINILYGLTVKKGLPLIDIEDIIRDAFIVKNIKTITSKHLFIFIETPLTHWFI